MRPIFLPEFPDHPNTMTQKVVVVGAGPVGSLAALYAAVRGFDVEVYELRAGKALYLKPSRF